MVKSGCNKKSLELDRQACVRYKALEKRDWDDRMWDTCVRYKALENVTGTMPKGEQWLGVLRTIWQMCAGTSDGL